MQFAKLLTPEGAQIPRPVAVTGSVSWDAGSGLANAWAEDGVTPLGELRNARVLWIGAAGIRLEGHEPVDLTGNRFRLMQWQIIF